MIFFFTIYKAFLFKHGLWFFTTHLWVDKIIINNIITIKIIII